MNEIIVCYNEKVRNFYRTREGLLRRIYYNQKYNSKKTGHFKILYSIDVFISACLTSDKFEELYIKWVDSGYNKWLKPSIDRKK